MSDIPAHKKYDLVVIGGGAGGMSATVTALGMGARTLIIEKAGRLGGECSWTGCVPSKTLIHLAAVAHHMRRHGVPDSIISEFASRSFDETRKTIVEIASGAHGQSALVDMGAEIIYGEPKFVGGHNIEINGQTIEARRAIVCTGSEPILPPVPGLRESNPLMNTNFFDIPKPPESIAVIGGGPIGVELAQALNRLGTKVIILGRNPRILPKDDAELTEMLAGYLIEDGIDLRRGVSVNKVDVNYGRRIVHFECGGEDCITECEQILVATGRTPNTKGLGLDEAGVHTDKNGITVDKNLRTTADWIYAAGDVVGHYYFAHAAEYEGILAVKNAFLPINEKLNYRWFPWATFTSPELAHLGPTEEELKEKGVKYSVYRGKFADDDRAQAELAGQGMVKILATPGILGGRLIGAHILGPRAGELMNELVIAGKKGAKMSDIALASHIYPTLGQVVQHTAVYWFSDIAKIPIVDKIMRYFARRV